LVEFNDQGSFLKALWMNDGLRHKHALYSRAVEMGTQLRSPKLEITTA
jgi:hypothetical protein